MSNKIIYCPDYDCVHNRDGICSKDEISIEMKFGEFRDGERKCYRDCQDYRERRRDD